MLRTSPSLFFSLNSRVWYLGFICNRLNGKVPLALLLLLLLLLLPPPAPACIVHTAQLKQHASQNPDSGNFQQTITMTDSVQFGSQHIINKRFIHDAFALKYLYCMLLVFYFVPLTIPFEQFNSICWIHDWLLLYSSSTMRRERELGLEAQKKKLHTIFIWTHYAFECRKNVAPSYFLLAHKQYTHFRGMFFCSLCFRFYGIIFILQRCHWMLANYITSIKYKYIYLDVYGCVCNAHKLRKAWIILGFVTARFSFVDIANMLYIHRFNSISSLVA